MLKIEPIDFDSKFIEATNQPNRKDKAVTYKKNSDDDDESIDINIVLENLNNTEKAAQSIAYLCEIPNLDDLLSEKSDIVQLIVSFLSPDTPELIIPSLKFLEKCCSYENFAVCLPDFISIILLIEIAFSTDSKQAIMFINEIIYKIVLSANKDPENDVRLFLEKADQSENDLLKSASMNILYAYLQKVHKITPFFQNISFIDRLNANLMILNYPKQLKSSLVSIKFCVTKLKIPSDKFNINQIIKLIRSNTFSIQDLSIEIVTNVLLITTSDEFPYKGQLCKSLHWIFHKGTEKMQKGQIKLTLKALYCIRTFFDLCFDQFPQLIELLDDAFFKIIFDLIPSGDNGSVEAITFLILRIHDDSHPECKQRVIEALLDLEIHDQLESLSESDDIVASHALVLLNLLDKYTETES